MSIEKVLPPVALVTGAARGIGRAYVITLLKKGWCVALIDLMNTDKAIREIVQQLKGDVQDRILGFTCDVTVTTQVKDAMIKTKSHFGRLDLLLNNAAIYHILFSHLERTVAVNLTAVIKNTELAVKMVTDSFKKPSETPFLIVNIASCAGFIPVDADMAPVYAATKFGVIGLTRSLKFLAPKFNVRVNCICPVTVDTQVTGDIDEETKRYLSGENRGGVIKPEACAEALLRIIEDSSLAGEAVVVHPSVGTKVEPLDPFGQFDYLGKWSFYKSKQTERFLDLAVQKVKSGAEIGWSCL
eukprot:TRINITY_DN339_c0_g1_i1.p1 TRINITY_DN339_c0_g1~~TRINITY_DN339_c0_g1_i1.p1  ORF type:complete len:299 (+),score=66.24 TRINITY_DN339_c0_g1_i1:113-1009(+)